MNTSGFPLVSGAEFRDMIYLERFVNDGSPNLRSFEAATSTPCSPRFGLPSFPLPWVALPHERLGHVADDVAPIGMLPLHPDCLPLAFPNAPPEIGSFSWAAPTSSGRTVFLCTSAGQIKLGYPLPLGRFPRPLRRDKVEHSLDISARLSAVTDPYWGDFYTESGGFVPSHPSMSEFCAIVRSSLPNRLATPVGFRFFPMVSLIARWTDPDRSVWKSMQQALGRSISETEVAEAVVRSFLRVTLASECVPEPHAQNLVLVVSNSELAVAWRDLQGFAPLPAHASAAAQLLSLRYDWYLGHYVLAPLCERYMEAGGDPTVFQSVVQGTFAAERSGIQEFPAGHWEIPLNAVTHGHRILPVFYPNSHEWRSK